MGCAADSETPLIPQARLRDGQTVSFRAAGAGDAQALREFFGGLCANSLRFRFFTGAANIDSAAHWAAVSEPGGMGIVAIDQTDTLIGHAAYVPLNEQSAEVAVEVADRLHGLGMGTIMVERLAEQAEARGVSQFVAEVLPDNKAMLDVFRDGFDAKVSFDRGTDAVEFPTSAWRLARLRFEG
ncbi:MAG TPA: GNAT family N-acetyltransferase [Solirubrobacteraceae bacterium]|jgi:RimJ/RimL family protein N-acetyltransferase|nr:GNAT family N-acetyltransferase [Solirubrobacteraceae bacterium]